MDDFFGLAINQIVQFGLSSLQGIYYLEQLFSPVSIVDINSERMFRKRLYHEFAADSVQGEELGTERYQIFDPIDGTRKFIRGIPTWGISIALEYQSKVVVAAIALPSTGDVWSAVYQGEAFKNGERIKVSNTPGNPPKNRGTHK